MLASGTVANVVGEMIRMGESTCVDAIVRFARAMVKVFGVRYLRENQLCKIQKG